MKQLTATTKSVWLNILLYIFLYMYYSFWILKVINSQQFVMHAMKIDT